jgi:hypothetical protein
MSSQLTLFDGAPSPRSDDAHAEALQRMHQEARGLAARLPPELHFGTSSWSFPGWRGLVYSGTRSQASLAREGCGVNPASTATTVGVDRNYYTHAN